MEFNLRKTAVTKAVKVESSFAVRHAQVFSQIFFSLFIFSLLLILGSFFSLADALFSLQASVVCLVAFLLFWEISLFVKNKLKATQAFDEGSNLAGYLDFDLCKIALGAEKFCKQRKINQIPAAALFYSAIKNGRDTKLICLRLGLNLRKAQDDLKNYLENSRTAGAGALSYTDSFMEVILEAGKIAKERGSVLIGEKEILAALARKDEFVKKVMLEADINEKDVENLTLWLGSVERAIESNKKFWTKENLFKKGSLGKDWASGYTITLDQFSIDWRDIVSRWTYKEIIGNQKEIESAEMVLARDSLSNVLLVGEPGTGRKSIVQAIAQRCYLQKNLQELCNKRVVELDMVKLASQIQDFETMETVLDRILSEVLSAGNVILVIDELQNFVGQETMKAGAVDISGILSKYLPMPKFQFIGICSYDGLHKKIEQNSSFLELFRKIEVQEVSEIETISIVQNYALELEQKHKILVLYPAVREIVNLSGRYFPSTPFPKKALDVLSEAVVYVISKNERIVMPHHIAEIISNKTEIPVGKMEFKEKEVLLNLESLIHKRIVNQSEAVREVSIAMRRARAGIASKKRPMGTFLFLGPTGVGKTETAKALSQIYFGSENKMIRIDMSEFQEISDIPRLLGAVSPVEMQGLLTTPVRENPFSLVLLDEIEKAHPNILNLFLQVFDEGHITDGQGRKILFTNTIIICTSNAGSEMIFKLVESNQKLIRQDLLGDLIQKKIFSPEFINRFDATVLFHPLTKENLMDIAHLSLESLKKNLKEKEIDFEISEALKEKIVELSYKPEFGAREMRRVIQDKVENSIAEALISDKIQKGDIIEINPETFEIIWQNKS